MMNNQKAAFEDADFVLKNINDKNEKTLFRRAMALKIHFKDYEKATRDFEQLGKLFPTN